MEVVENGLIYGKFIEIAEEEEWRKS